jgi:hypothetical protein
LSGLWQWQMKLDKNCVQPLMEFLVTDEATYSSPEKLNETAAAIWNLGYVQGGEAIQSAIATDSPIPANRAYAALALSFISGKSVDAPLVPLLKEQSAPTRLTAALALALSGRSEGLSIALGPVGEKDPCAMRVVVPLLDYGVIKLK